MKPFALQTNVNAILLTAVCATQAFLFSCSSRNHSPTENMSSLDSIHTLISSLQKKAQMYYNLGALDQLPELATMTKDFSGNLYEDLTAGELLFVFLSDAEIETDAPGELVSQAYMRALETLPGNWWGTPGTLDTEMGRRLLSKSHSAATWVEALSNPALVPYSGSETSTLAKEFKWTVADLAAGFLSEKQNLPYDWRAPAAQRRVQIEAIRNAVAP